MDKRIVIVENDADTRRLLEYIVGEEGYKTFAFENAQAALEAADEIRPDLAIVDLMMGEMDGVELSRQFRARPQFDKMPILILTARDHAIDRYEAFAVGVDDYITKPFDSIELTFRIRAFLRRAGGGKSTPSSLDNLEVGEVKLEPARFRATVRGVEVTLTKLETVILHFLMRHPGQVYSASQLSENALAEGGRSVDAAHAHIRHLRQKLEIDLKHPCIIVTMGRKGYYFAQSAS